MSTELIDPFQRRVTYVRLSVTDRCDFRCVYCMSEEMTFLPRTQVLSLEELYRIARVFTEMGVDKIRLTGGEPLVRRDVVSLVAKIGRLPGLKDFAMTSNGSQLPKLASALREAGLHRLNVSLDSLNPSRFRELTRTGDLAVVLRGIEAAQRAGFDRIKLNSVIMRDRNEDEVLPLVEFARERGLDISFIEEMPLGQINEHDRAESFLASAELREIIGDRFLLTPTTEDSGGPSRYYRMVDSDIRVGFISPHSHNFCHLCNRVRVTVEGRLLLCLGNEHSVDLMPVLRGGGSDQDLQRTILTAMEIKPERHHFTLEQEPQILRFMNATGG